MKIFSLVLLLYSDYFSKFVKEKIVMKGEIISVIKAEIDNLHPHKFRRTLATKAIDKGMPIEQLQTLLGHSQINTTMEYAIVNQSNIKTSHKKYIA